MCFIRLMKDKLCPHLKVLDVSISRTSSPFLFIDTFGVESRWRRHFFDLKKQLFHSHNFKDFYSIKILGDVTYFMT